MNNQRDIYQEVKQILAESYVLAKQIQKVKSHLAFIEVKTLVENLKSKYIEVNNIFNEENKDIKKFSRDSIEGDFLTNGVKMRQRLSILENKIKELSETYKQEDVSFSNGLAVGDEIMVNTATRASWTNSLSINAGVITKVNEGSITVKLYKSKITHNYDDKSKTTGEKIKTWLKNEFQDKAKVIKNRSEFQTKDELPPSDFNYISTRFTER